MQKHRRPWNYTFRVGDLLRWTAGLAVVFAAYRLAPLLTSGLLFVLLPTLGHFQALLLLDAERRRPAANRRYFEHGVLALATIVFLLPLGLLTGSVFGAILTGGLQTGAALVEAPEFGGPWLGALIAIAVCYSFGAAGACCGLAVGWPLPERRQKTPRSEERRALYSAASRRWYYASLAGVLIACIGLSSMLMG